MVVGFSPEEARTLMAILNEKETVYKYDLETKYEGDPKFGEEDERFLRDQVEVVGRIKSKMVAMGFRQ